MPILPEKVPDPFISLLYFPPVTIADFDYEYDKNSNITSQTFGHRTSDPYNMYAYDTLDRLTQADYLVGVLTEDEQFTYDSLGNRTNVNLRNGSNEVYSLSNPNLNNEYTTIGVNSLTHDTAGNMTECNLDYTYEYDYENRLTSIEDDQQNLVAEYTYDAFGRRIEKIAGGVTTRYYYDGWRVLTEVEGSNSKDFVYGNYLDEVLIMIVDDGQNQTDHYYAHDHLFSPVALIADDGTVEERYEYDAYGRMTRLDPDFTAWSGTPAGNPYYFTGQRLDELDSGSLLIMYYKNRYYLVDIGRFVQRDSLGVNDGICIIEFTDSGVPHFPRKNNITDQYRDGLSLYEYVQSNPLNKQDPYGLYYMPWVTRMPSVPQKTACGCYAKREFEPVWALKKRSKGILYANGKPCHCVECSDIKVCLSDFGKVQRTYDAGFLGYLAGTEHSGGLRWPYVCWSWVKEALKKCCLEKSTYGYEGLN